MAIEDDISVHPSQLRQEIRRLRSLLPENLLSGEIAARDLLVAELGEWYYRLMRVTNRESEKALTDAMLYGCGFVEYRGDEDPKYIPTDQVFV